MDHIKTTPHYILCSAKKDRVDLIQIGSVALIGISFMIFSVPNVSFISLPIINVFLFFLLNILGLSLIIHTFHHQKLPDLHHAHFYVRLISTYLLSFAI